jgi:hypothetical protein
MLYAFAPGAVGGLLDAYFVQGKSDIASLAICAAIGSASGYGALYLNATTGLPPMAGEVMSTPYMVSVGAYGFAGAALVGYFM